VSFDFVIAGVGGQPIDRMIEVLAAACQVAGQGFSSTAPRGVLLLGGSRLAQVSVGECWSAIVTEDTGNLLVGLEVGEALRAAKFCARDGVALVDTLAIPPSAPRDRRPYPGAAQIEPALREVIENVHVVDFAALAAKAGAPPDCAYMFLLGAASRVGGLDLLKESWQSALKSANATDGESLAFEAGALWAKEAKLA
jgi:Pyruvate/2-oxoacid:ferredoxin oxidoreductase gamma subunit